MWLSTLRGSSFDYQSVHTNKQAAHHCKLGRCPHGLAPARPPALPAHWSGALLPQPSGQPRPAPLPGASARAQLPQGHPPRLPCAPLPAACASWFKDRIMVQSTSMRCLPASSALRAAAAALLGALAKSTTACGRHVCRSDVKFSMLWGAKNALAHFISVRRSERMLWPQFCPTHPLCVPLPLAAAPSLGARPRFHEKRVPLQCHDQGSRLQTMRVVRSAYFAEGVPQAGVHPRNERRHSPPSERRIRAQ